MVFVFTIQFAAIVYALAFTLSSSTNELETTNQVAAGDFDGDGDVDYVAVNNDPAFSENSRLYTNDGSGNFTAGTGFTKTGSQVDSSVGDIDGDGDLDFILFATQAGPVYNVYKYVNNGSGTFSETTLLSNISSATGIKVLLGDFDNDGDLDFALADTNVALNLYKNDGRGNFSVTTTSVIPVLNSKMASGDFNSDGYLDIVAVTSSNTVGYLINSGTGMFVTAANTNTVGSAQHLRVADVDGDGDLDVVASKDTVTRGYVPLLNDGTGVFTASTQVNSATVNQFGGPGDVDNDGDFDFVGGGAISENNHVFVNNGSGVFSDSGTTPTSSDLTNDIQFFDIDNDGDLDYVYVQGGRNRHVKSDQAATSANTAPTAPSTSTMSAASATSLIAGRAAVTLAWGSGSDSQTSTRLLQYNVRVGTGASANNIVSGIAGDPSFVSRLLPNGQSRRYALKNLPCSATYYWAVSVVDSGFKSTTTTEQTFTVGSDCTVTSSSSSPPPPPSGGGGLGWFVKRPKPIVEPKDDPPGDITISAFRDLNGDGKKQDNEQKPFKGLAFTITGTSKIKKQISVKTTLQGNGEVTVSLVPSDGSGYTVTMDTGSSVIKGYVPTSPVKVGKLVVTTGSKKTVSFGLLRADLLRYAPCTAVTPPENDDSLDGESLKLLRRLVDIYGGKIDAGVALGKGLVTRREFLTLLLRTQCVTKYTDLDLLKERLRQAFAAARATKGNTWKAIVLQDLMLNLRTEDSSTVYALLAAMIPAHRTNAKGNIADLDAPVSRGEAITMVEAAMQIPAARKEKSVKSVPKDVQNRIDLAPEFATLQNLGVLPESFLEALSPDLGMNANEAGTLLIRAAFRAGRINLVPQIGGANTGKSSPTFLSLIPGFSLPACFEKKEERSSTVVLPDVLPGDKKYADIAELLSWGTKNAEGKMLWLLTGTARPTEFGIEFGGAPLRAGDYASVLETLRALLVLQCLPPETASAVRGNPLKGLLKEGSGESRVPKDRVSNLPRDTSFASRVLYRSQDRTKEFDLSLFTYAPWLLMQPTRDPMDGLSIRDGADLLASGLMGVLVRTKVLTPQQAQEKVGILAEGILRSFQNRAVDPKELGPTTVTTCKQVPVVTGRGRKQKVTYVQQCTTKKTPAPRETDSKTLVGMSRGMLVDFLATVVEGKLSTSDGVGNGKPLGELWWERIGSTAELPEKKAQGEQPQEKPKEQPSGPQQPSGPTKEPGDNSVQTPQGKSTGTDQPTTPPGQVPQKSSGEEKGDQNGGLKSTDAKAGQK